MQPRMGPPVGKSAFKLEEKQAALQGQPQAGPSPGQDLALQPFKQSAWEASPEPRAQGCSEAPSTAKEDSVTSSSTSSLTRDGDVPSSKARGAGQGEEISPQSFSRAPTALDAAEKGPGPPRGPPEGKMWTVPPHCKLDSPGGQHGWGHTTQVVGDSVLQGVLLLHHEDGEPLQPHQDALLVIHFEEENLDLETEEKNDPPARGNGVHHRRQHEGSGWRLYSKNFLQLSSTKNKGPGALKTLWMRSPPSEPGRRPFPLTALFVVLLMVREEELLLGFAISRPVLKS